MKNQTLVTTHHPTNISRSRLFEDLYQKYKNDLTRYAHWLSGDREVAEDLVQETLLRAWKSLDKLNSISAAKSWLITILRRENARRFERYQPVQVDIPLETISSGRVLYDTSTEAFVMRRAVNRLAEEYRTPLMMQIVDGYSQKEIAHHVGITAAGVGTRLFRARNKLRELLAA